MSGCIARLPFIQWNSPPNTYEEQSLFSNFFISISLWTLSSELISVSVSSPDKLIMKVYDEYEDPPVWAHLDPLSHLMKLVKLLITILSNILFEPLNQEKKKQCTLL